MQFNSILVFAFLAIFNFAAMHSFGKIPPFVHQQKLFSKTASRAVINVKFEQKSASRAEVKHKNGLKTILFRKILGRTHFKHVFRNYAAMQVDAYACCDHQQLCVMDCGRLARFRNTCDELV